MVIVVRTDLRMGKGKIASQAAHAAVILVTQNAKQGIVTQWLTQGQPKLVLKADSYEHLMELYHRAKALNINVCQICDAGHTQVEPGTTTVIGIGPGASQSIDEVTKDLKLL